MREVMEKDSDISPSLASVSEAAEAPPTALVKATHRDNVVRLWAIQDVSYPRHLFSVSLG